MLTVRSGPIYADLVPFSFGSGLVMAGSVFWDKTRLETSRLG